MSEPSDGAGEGHNSGKVVWERWTKKRTFVRALEGTYGQLKEELYSQPRVYKTTDLKWHGGPQQLRQENCLNPQANRIAQAIEAHVEVFSPEGLWSDPWPHEFRSLLCAQRQGTRHS